jgi:hypothetical protein
MIHSRSSQRGEGRIGCIVSLLVLALLAAISAKIIPVMTANNSLCSTAEDLGSRAGLMTAKAIELQLRAKASALEIPEALPPGAMTVDVQGDKQSGTCVIKFKFTRKIDFYGITTYSMDIDKTFIRPFMDAR